MADNIQATPRNYLGGLLSDAYNWMQSPQRTQQMQGFAGLLGTTGIPQTIERMAYGEPLTNIGRANVPLLKPETADALMTVGGFAPEIKAAAKMLPKNVPVGMGIKPVDDVVGLLTPSRPVFDVSKRDASEIFGAGAQRVIYKDPTSGGAMEVLAKPDGTASVLSLEVPEKFRGKGIGESLQSQVMQDFPSMMGQVSSKAAAKTAYRLGRRPPSMPDATLDDVYKLMDENSSVNLVSPEMQKTFMPAQPSFTYPQEEAMRLAQQRAALPVEQGGLGLLSSNTAQQRADAMFPFDVYHGTNADIQVMNTAGKGKTSGAGAFVNDNPLAAETYVNASGGGNIIPMRMSKEGLLDVNAKGRNWADIETNTLAPKAGKKRYSLDEMELQKNDVTSTDELGMIAKDLLGLQGVNIKNVKDLGPNSHIFRAKEYLQDKYGIVPDETWSNVTGNQFAEARDYMDKLYKSQKSTVTAVQDPDLLRSRFAAFDPWRRTAAIASAMGVAAPDLLAQEQPVITQQQIDDELAKYGLLGR